MSHRCFALLGVLALAIAVVSLATVLAAGQASSPAPTARQPAAAEKWAQPHTPDGKPDLQGVWSFATITPLERPAELAGKEFFTPQEAVDYERELLKRNNMDR